MRLAASILLLCTAGCTQLQRLLPVALAADERLARAVTIVRDEWGVPSVYAPTDAAVAFGVGYAQAEDDFWQLEEEYIHALGRASNYYGEPYLAADLVSAAFQVERLSREEYEREPAERKAVWSAYTAGINYFLRTQQQRPRLIARFEPWMPFALFRAVPAGTTMDGVRVGALSTGTLPDTSSSAAAVTYVGTWPDSTGTAATLQPDGSAAWAIAPSRTTSRRALLMHNPHVNLRGPGQLYELHVHSEAGWHARGFARLGTPAPANGFNERIAWAVTPTTDDHADVYEVTFDHPSDPLQYRYDGGWRTAERWADTLYVNGASGVETRVYSFIRTHHGPIVARRGNRALAARVPRMQEGGALQQLHAMSRAAGLDEFRQALALVALPAASTLYADVDGNIYHVQGSAVAVRDTTIDWRRPVDGSSPSMEWQGYVALAELPQQLNPETGWLLSLAGSPSAADTPAPTTNGEDAARQALLRILVSDSARSLDDFAKAAFATYVTTAERAIAPLVREWEEVGGTNPVRAMRLDEALDRLRAWDRISTNGSVEMTLFTLWQERLRTGSDSGAYRHFRAFEAVLEQMQREWDSTFVPWGEVQRLQRLRADAGARFDDAAASLPIAAGPAWSGIVFHAASRQSPGTRRRYITRAGSVSIVELGTEISARSIVTFGQCADPASPHFADQASLYVRGQLKPARFTHTDVLANAHRSYRPGTRPGQHGKPR